MDLPHPEAVPEAAQAEPVTAALETAPEVSNVPVPNAEAVAVDPAPLVVMPSEEDPVPAVIEPSSVESVAVTEEASVHGVETPEISVEAAAEGTPAYVAPEPVPEIPVPQPTAASTSDDEVMAALQTLIPSSESGAVAATDASNGTGTSYPAHSAHPRWVAEEVGLAMDEATISLEQEMATAYSTFSGQAAHSAETATHVPTAVKTESTVVPATEPIEQPAVEALASAAAVGEGSSAHSTITGLASPGCSSTEPSAEITTSTSEMSSAAASSTAEPVPEGIHTIEGEVMAASWKNIRDSIAGAAAKPAPTKEEFRDIEPASADRNAAPSVEQSAPQFKATDPTSIANIVDSVLAELRPKIVEEIARKLADSKKE
jgi:hypothetical protein